MYLRSERNKHVSTEPLNRSFRGIVKTEINPLTILGGMESWPADYFVFNEIISFPICISFILLKENVSRGLVVFLIFKIIGCLLYS